MATFAAGRSKMHERVRMVKLNKELEPLGDRTKNDLWGNAERTYQIAKDGSSEIAALVVGMLETAAQNGQLSDPQKKLTVADLVNGIAHDISTHQAKLAKINSEQAHHSGGTQGDIELQEVYSIHAKYADEVAVHTELVKASVMHLSELLEASPVSLQDKLDATEQTLSRDPSIISDAVVMSDTHKGE
jgi:hypothetical protein